MGDGKDEKDILIHPRRGRTEKGLPTHGLLLVNPAEAAYAHKKWRDGGGEPRKLFNSDLTVQAGGGAFVAGPSIGAPMAVIILEKLIALGAESIVLFGWCGAISDDLEIGDVLLPDMAISGEGTSLHYPHDTPIMPHLETTTYLREWLRAQGCTSRSGGVWSTDAVFRENRRALRSLHDEQGVMAVDMEFSALCVVAAYRKIAFSAILVVSDLLTGRSGDRALPLRNFSLRRARFSICSFREEMNGGNRYEDVLSGESWLCQESC